MIDTYEKAKFAYTEAYKELLSAEFFYSMTLSFFEHIESEIIENLGKSYFDKLKEEIESEVQR